MSRADDASLLAMKSARMSVASMAWTMGWSEARVERRLQALAPAPAARLRAGRTEPPADAKPVRGPAVGQLGEGEGLVTRAFALHGGGYGAAVLLAGDLLAFTETGHRRLAQGDQVAVAPGAGVYQIRGGAHGAL